MNKRTLILGGTIGLLVGGVCTHLIGLPFWPVLLIVVGVCGVIGAVLAWLGVLP